MPDPTNPSGESGIAIQKSLDPQQIETPQAPEAKPSLRDIAEQSYDSVLEQADTGTEPSAPSGERHRDEHGRFAPKEAKPGEAIDGKPVDPAPKVPPDPTKADPAQAQPGASNQPPENWSAEDKAVFAKAPPELQEWAVRRHREMEAGVHERMQAAASAINFTNVLHPIFADPIISESLKRDNVTPTDAIRQWATWHYRAMSPNAADRVALLQELAERIGVDPAAIGTSQPAIPGLTPQELNDPAIKFFADTMSANAQKLKQIEQDMARRTAEEQTSRQQTQYNQTLSEINTFADAKDAAGNPLRPRFDEYTSAGLIGAFIQANPQATIEQAYKAVDDTVNNLAKTKTDAALKASEAQRSVQRAQLAVRGNARGSTSTVTKPPANGGARSLRDILDESADEVGM